MRQRLSQISVPGRKGAEGRAQQWVDSSDPDGNLEAQYFCPQKYKGKLKMFSTTTKTTSHLEPTPTKAAAPSGALKRLLSLPQHLPRPVFRCTSWLLPNLLWDTNRSCAHGRGHVEPNPETPRRAASTKMAPPAPSALYNLPAAAQVRG